MASPTGDDDTDTNFSFTSDHIEDQPTSVGAGGASSHPPNCACVAHCVIFVQHAVRDVCKTTTRMTWVARRHWP